MVLQGELIFSIPNDKLKAFADNKLNVAKKMMLSLVPAFSPFPAMFSKAFIFSIVLSLDCMVKI